MNRINNISTIGSDCVGCGNCALICPKSAVSMLADQEGFLYPTVNKEKCINCGVCSKKCPQLQVVRLLGKQEGYIAISKDKNLYKNSASGGVFASIGSEFLNCENSYICGAAFLDGMVKHILISDKNDIKLLQNSKYVQSYMGHCFEKIRDYLNRGSKILFSGTPCQVNALHTFIGNHDNLYTIDLICHGVPSPAFLRKDLQIYGENTDYKYILFRKKHKIYKSKGNFFLTLKQERSKKVVSVPYNRDPYFKLFMEGKTFRYSCYNCHYANLNRVGDLTIGDCDSSSKYPDFHKDEATSTILINTEKGRILFQLYGSLIQSKPIDIQIEACCNHQLNHAFEMPPERKDIYLEIKELNATEIRKKYAKPYTLKGHIYQILNVIFPHKIVSKLFH